ncbi:MAG TPA: hypothetical protein VF548_05060 [Allosphingosinicella sp.]|jgi:hypothetical protein
MSRGASNSAGAASPVALQQGEIVRTYRLQAGGDDYWKAFQLCRIRLAYVYRLRHLFPEPWSQQDFECFFLHSRLLIEQICVFFREAAIDRGGLRPSEAKAYAPDKILRPYQETLEQLRFITLGRFRVYKVTPEELQIDARYQAFIRVDIQRLSTLYGRTNNFLHVTAKEPSEAHANQAIQAFFEFFAEVAAIFDRHAVERCDATQDGPPESLDRFEIIVGREDETGEDEFWECGLGQWKSRLREIEGRS